MSYIIRLSLDILYQQRHFITLLLLVIFAGLAGKLILAAMALLFIYFILKEEWRSLYVLFSLLTICVVSNNLTPAFSFASKLRFVCLGLSLFHIYTNKLQNYRIASIILPYSVITFITTYYHGILGIEYLARAVSFYLMFFSISSLIIDVLSQKKVFFYFMMLSWMLMFALLNYVFCFITFGENVEGNFRFKGIMGNSNGLSMFMIILFPLIDMCKLCITGIKNNYYDALKLACFVLILLTGSRNGLICIIFYESIIRFYKYRGIIIIVAMILAMLFSNIDMRDIKHVTDYFGISERLRINSLEDASGRTVVWDVAKEEIKKQPWLGKGMGYDNYFIIQYGEEHIGANRARHWYGIWNSYYSMLLNVGYVGLILYFLFLYKGFIYSQNKIIAIATTCVVLFSAITESWLVASMNSITPLYFTYLTLQIKDT